MTHADATTGAGLGQEAGLTTRGLLAALLVRAFGDAELRRFVTSHTSTSLLAATLPGAGSDLATLADAVAAGVLAHRERIPEFVQDLKAERPWTAPDLDALDWEDSLAPPITRGGGTVLAAGVAVVAPAVIGWLAASARVRVVTDVPVDWPLTMVPTLWVHGLGALFALIPSVVAGLASTLALTQFAALGLLVWLLRRRDRPWGRPLAVVGAIPTLAFAAPPLLAALDIVGTRPLLIGNALPGELSPEEEGWRVALCNVRTGILLGESRLQALAVSLLVLGLAAWMVPGHPWRRRWRVAAVGALILWGSVAAGVLVWPPSTSLPTIGGAAVVATMGPWSALLGADERGVVWRQGVVAAGAPREIQSCVSGASADPPPGPAQ